MKYEYKIYICPLNILRIELPKEISLVSDLLEDDIHSEHGLQYLNRVLNGEVNHIEIGGNSCDLKIRTDYTKIVHRYYEEEENTCEIETIELKSLMLVWLAEYEIYLQNRDSN
ncbi:MULTISPECIES: hypothetical protein [unclassified Bacillus (in: firmicutes)]|uniref:hypothetical protein n=1 Tax=unclassified Bacillus (in: firmicutes) TaxID=185979 RepID=UPI00232F9A42|nr:hypothetical protein [Bacillus sp. BP-3]MDC2864222.1 hypothetical protein [Bacillus sp. BP-3]